MPFPLHGFNSGFSGLDFEAAGKQIQTRLISDAFNLSCQDGADGLFGRPERPQGLQAVFPRAHTLARAFFVASISSSPAPRMGFPDGGSRQPIDPFMLADEVKSRSRRLNLIGPLLNGANERGWATERWTFRLCRLRPSLPLYRRRYGQTT